jgi:hypothetical protein
MDWDPCSNGKVPGLIKCKNLNSNTPVPQQWLKPVILAIQEAEIRKIVV